ncbi:MAG: hypothetical protein ACO3QQ_07290, partial [Candidatus Nanopelagicaceae bacterium]
LFGEVMSSTDLRHANLICEVAGGFFQSYCACGWSSTISFYEEVDLLRAMHAHAVVSFPGFR